MSVMTAGEHKRPARAPHGRTVATAVPGRPNVMAGPWPGAGGPQSRAAHGTTAGPAAARAQAARARPARARVRLTRRGRIVVAGLLAAGMMMVAAVAWLAGTARADASGSGVPSSAVYHSLRSVVVMPGQSLWSIATQYEPAADPGSAIQEIITLNALRNTSVQPGEHLWLPRG
jgi:LysM domain-containing protein